MGVVVLGAAISMIFSPAAGASAAPLKSNSFYVTSYDLDWAHQKGCHLGETDRDEPGTQRHVAVLDFGALSQVSGGWEVSAFTGASFSVEKARQMVEQFARGYYGCTGTDTTSTLFIGFGTNNSAGTITSAAGKKLANAAIAANDTITQSGWKQAHAIGANDFEAFGKPASGSTASKAWIDGYNSVSGRPFFVNYGSADGCPTSSFTSGTACNAGLNSEAIYHVSWTGSAYPLPEIYTTSGSQAKQWMYLSLYSYTQHSSAFLFQGVMTQHGACAQASCSGTDNTPSAGWNQLTNQLQTNSHTATTVGAPTDIRWE